MTAEVDFLAREKFTGHAVYWKDGQEMRRKLTIVDMGERSQPAGDVLERSNGFSARFREWIENGEGKLKIFFSRGFVKKIEF